MSRITVFVGLDYHQDSVQVCVLDKKGKMLRNRSCANHWRAIVEKVRGCGRVAGVALESCELQGFIHEPISKSHFSNIDSVLTVMPACSKRASRTA